MELEGDLAHLLPPYQAIAAKENQERIEWIRHDRWINHTKAEHVLARLSDLLTYPPRSRMPSLLIFGAPGMGKTTAGKRRSVKFSLCAANIWDPATVFNL